MSTFLQSGSDGSSFAISLFSPSLPSPLIAPLVFFGNKTAIPDCGMVGDPPQVGGA